MKLREYLQQNWLSRRLITSAIDDWKFFLNWEIVQSYWIEIKEWDKIVYGNKKFDYDVISEQKESKLLAFYKPVGYVCSKSDPNNTTIYEILSKEYHGWYYIWRLDRDSRGLVLMTNDPKMVDQYEHPRHWITKEYLVTLNKSFHKEDIDRCLQWIEDKEDVLKCVECQVLNTSLVEQYHNFLLPDLIKSPSCVIRIVLNEGKKRHIRRMMSAMRYHVEDLVRISEGEFDLGDLKEGNVRIISQ